MLIKKCSLSKPSNEIKMKYMYMYLHATLNNITWNIWLEVAKSNIFAFSSRES